MRLRLTVLAALLAAAYLLGSYRGTNVDQQGAWCAHFNGFFICNDQQTDEHTADADIDTDTDSPVSLTYVEASR